MEAFPAPKRRVAHTVLYSSKRKTHKKKEEKRKKQGARLVEALKSHITNTKFHFREVTIISEDYKIFLYISKNYNQQSRSSHRSTPSQGKNHKKEKEKEKEKEKRKEKEKAKSGDKEKIGEDRNNGKSGT